MLLEALLNAKMSKMLLNTEMSLEMQDLMSRTLLKIEMSLKMQDPLLKHCENLKCLQMQGPS